MVNSFLRRILILEVLVFAIWMWSITGLAEMVKCPIKHVFYPAF